MLRPLLDSLSRLASVLPRFPVTGPPLLAAASSGDTSRIAQLVREGEDVDLQNRWGQTALHVAARRGRYDAAALLLLHGASHSIVDAKGHAPLAEPNTSLPALHSIRQRYKRAAALEGPRGSEPATPIVADWLNDLRRDGILRISGLVPSALVSRMKEEFSAFVTQIDNRRAHGEAGMKTYDEEEHWWPEDLAYVSNNAFKYSRSLTAFCCGAELVELTDRYLGKRALITRGVAMRYLPQANRGTDMFGWHHDIEDRRIKAMVLLTQVDESDQAMSYVIGSHALYHPYEMFLRNTSSLEYCQEKLGKVEIRHTIGKPGDVFIFDSNGTHRGNRRPDARVRDTFFVEYNTDASNIWGGDVQADVFDGLAFPNGNPFTDLMSAEKKWTRPVTRTHPTWIENLPRIETWR